MDYLTTRGLVLRTTEYKETDRILTVLSANHGLLTMKARGVRSNRSKLKGACQLLTYAEFTVGEAHGFSSITEATAIEMFPELRTDIVLLSLASYFAQLAEVLSQEDAASPALLPLILNALYALAKLKKPPQLVKAATELRLAALAGYLPELSGSRDTCILEAGEGEGIYLAELNLDMLQEYRKREVHGNAYRRPEKYGILTETAIREPFIRADRRKECSETVHNNEKV